MRNAEVNHFPTVSLSGFWFRLIPSRFPTIDIYRRVAPGHLWPLASAIETATNPRVRLKEKLTKGCDQPNAVPPKLQNWNHAPFAYRNPAGSHFLSGDFGVLELSDTVQTALASSIRKREAFLADCRMPPVDLEMRVLKHEVRGSFTDLTSLAPDTPQQARWSLGKALVDKGCCGVRFRNPDRPAGYTIAVFDGDLLGPSIQTQHYKFRWDGERIKEVYNFRDENDGRPLLADEIFAAKSLPL
jgi:hypothetical protein